MNKWPDDCGRLLFPVKIAFFRYLLTGDARHVTCMRDGGVPGREGETERGVFSGCPMRMFWAVAGRSGVALLLMVAFWVHAVEVKTDDGFCLELDRSGMVSHCRIDGSELLADGTRGGFFVADVSALPEPDRELVEDPGFEDVTEGKNGPWQIGAEWSVDTTVCHSGQVSMRAVVPGEEARSSEDLSQEISVMPNTPYCVSMWIRTGGAFADMYIQQLDGEGNMRAGSPQLTTGHPRSSTDWVCLSRSFVTDSFCRRVRIRTNIWRQTGTVWVDDVSLICLEDECTVPQQQVEGETVSTDEGVEVKGVAGASGLSLKAVFAGRDDRIMVRGELEDRSGRDRAVTVSFRLPIAAAGWTWYDDIYDRQPIEAGIPYGAARLMGGDGRRTVALYPFAAMGDRTRALAMAVPMDRPRAFRLGYESRFGCYVNYEFGLTPATTKFPGRASFEFCIYRIDPEWGFRSAAQRYYDAHPQFFRKRVSVEDSIGSLLPPEKYQAPDYVFPAYVDFGWHQRKSLPAYRRELSSVLQYTEFIGWWGWAIGISPEQAETRPSPEEALEHVRELASREPPNEVARCILNCIPYGRDGQPRLHHAYVPKWGGYNYLCNPDPEIRDLGGGDSNRYRLTLKREVSQVDTYDLAGMRYDNPVVFAMDNFRRDHFRGSDHPLAFDHVSRKPVLPLDFSTFECAKAIADDMHARGKIVGANYTPAQYPSDMFVIQCLDIIGSETLWTWPGDNKLRLQRTLAFQKTVAMCWQEAKKDWDRSHIERELKEAMFYGTFYYFSTMGDELYDRWMPLTRRLARAGWMPVTHARCDDPDIRIERFGSRDTRDLYVTLRNESGDAKSPLIRLDAGSLNLSVHPRLSFWLMDGAAAFESIEVDRGNEQWLATVPIPGRDTVVVRIATGTDLVLDLLTMAPDALRKAQNYREVLQSSGLVCPDYSALLAEADTLIGQLRGSYPEPREAQERIRNLAGRLTEPQVPADSGVDAFLLARLRKHHHQAERALECAAAALNSM